MTTEEPRLKISHKPTPGDKSDFTKWRPGTEVSNGIRKVICEEAGKPTPDGDKARLALITDLKKEGPINWNTFARVHGDFEGLQDMLIKINERNGGPVFTDKALSLFEVNDERFIITSLTRENIRSLFGVYPEDLEEIPLSQTETVH
jgi:hypothetical protein